MRGAFSLGQLFGIRILVHWTFFLILLYAVFMGWKEGSSAGQTLVFMALILVIFFCVVLHELGHALTARRYGIGTKKIVLLPIGGVAQLERMPEKPREEFVVAIAGPLVNVAIALLIMAALIPLSGGTLWFTNPGHAWTVFISDVSGTQKFLLYLLMSNVALVLFNMIPAFPMDGGRVLRAVLALLISHPSATNIAAILGQTFAVIFAVGGIYFEQWLWPFVAIFIFFGARAEAKMVAKHSVLKQFSVRDGMLIRFKTLKPGDSLTHAVQELLAGSDRDFLVVEEQQVHGILTRDDLIEAISDLDNATPIKEIMITDFPKAEINDGLESTVAKMREHNLPILPVYEDGRFAGVLSMENVSELFVVGTMNRSPAERLRTAI